MHGGITDTEVLVVVVAAAAIVVVFLNDSSFITVCPEW